jgi:hypothetical protein
MAWIDTSVCLGHPEYPDLATEDKLLTAMDAADISMAWIFGYDAIGTHDFDASNNAVQRIAAKHPDRFVPIGLINPVLAFPAVNRLLDNGFKSIKVVCGWGNWLTIDNIRRLVGPVVEALHGRGLHLSVTVEGNVPTRGGSAYIPLVIREASPDIPLIVDRCWTPQAWEDYLTIAKQDPSLWFSLNSLPQRLLERVVGELGLHRVLLASWYPETDLEIVQHQIARAVPEVSDPGSVFAANAMRALSGQHPKSKG